jgi:hypothetical protein
MKWNIYAVALGLGLLGSSLPQNAHAAVVPANAGYTEGTDGAVINVHARNYRHCHWRHGERWCHGGRRWSGDGGGLSLYLNFGGHRHHHRHWRDRNWNGPRWREHRRW